MKTAFDLSQALQSGSVTAREILDDVYRVINRLNPKLNAIIDTQQERAYEIADQVDTKRQNGESLPPLAGVPVALKDNLLDQHQEVTCASNILKGFVSPYTATAVQKLRDQYLIPVARANMDEFAMGSSTEYSAYGPTKNPWDTTCVPGGSSGGSAACVASGMVPLSLGSDTGGSIRQPASFCGIVGLKPTYGRVSRYGLVAFASSLDQIGPFATTAQDAALLLEVISGHDHRDSTSENVQVDTYSKDIDKAPKPFKIGVPKLFLDGEISQEVKENFVKALDDLKQFGITWEAFDLGYFEEALSAYYILAPAEASANLERYDGVRYGARKEGATLKEMIRNTRGQGFGSEVKRRIILGTYVLSSGYYDAYYLKAQKVRHFVKKQYENAFKTYDFIATPTSPTPAFKLGEMVSDPLTMYYADIATIPVNLTGLPGISFPCGFSSKGLPVGFQLIGKSFQESALLQVAHHYQTVTSHHLQKPEIN